MEDTHCLRGACRCLSSFKADSTGRCIRVFLNDLCSTAPQCSSHISHSTCTNHLCACTNSYKPSDNFDRCIPMALSEASCSDDEDCEAFSENTSCLGGKCVCQEGFRIELHARGVLMNVSDDDAKESNGNDYNHHRTTDMQHSFDHRMCEKYRISDACARNISCATSIQGSFCTINNVCQCIGGFALRNDSCERRKIGDVGCSSDSDCSMAVACSRCEEGVCACEAGYRSADNDSRCFRVQLGDECLTSQDCIASIEGSECIEDSCDCQLGYGPPIPVVRRSNGPTAEFLCEALMVGGGRCRNDTDCVLFNRNSSCLNGSCVCDRGHYVEEASNTKICMLRRLRVGGCHDDLECTDSIENSVCGDGLVCVCALGYVEFPNSTDGDSCRARTLDDHLPCSLSGDCEASIVESACVEARCQCRSNHIQVDTSSCRQRRVDDTCSSNETCLFFSPSSYCSTALQCECGPGYVAEDDLLSCEVRRIGSVGCQANLDCYDAVRHSVCEEGECLCTVGYAAEEDRASCRIIQIGTACYVDDDCGLFINDSFCYSSTCHCHSGYLAEASMLACVRMRIGDRGCVGHQMCRDAVEDSFCELETCLCVAGHAVNEERDQCVRRKLEDACVSNEDCSDSIANGNCSQSGNCVCELGHYPNNSYSCLRRKLQDGSGCAEDVDCSSVINGSRCEGGKCGCIAGHTGTEDLRHCRARVLGDACQRLEDCNAVVAFARCSRRRCSCLSGYAGIGVHVCQKRRIGDDNCNINADCADAVEHSECNRFETENQTKATRNMVCECIRGYYDDSNGTVCIRRQIGDHCSRDEDCSYAVTHSLCQHLNCTCDYDHMVVPPNYTLCVDRPIIDQYQADLVLSQFRTTHGCGRIGRYHKLRRQCPRAHPCQLAWTHRGVYRKEVTCYRANAYVLKLNLSEIVGRYELVALHFNRSFVFNTTSDAYWENSVRLSFNGFDKILRSWNVTVDNQKLKNTANNNTTIRNNTNNNRNNKYRRNALTSSNNHNNNTNNTNNNNTNHLGMLVSRFLSSEVVLFRRLKPAGVQVEIVLFFETTHSKALLNASIEHLVLHYLLQNEGEVGASKMHVTKPYQRHVRVEDFDECRNNYSSERVAERVDCDLNAFCINTVGSYECVCNTSFVEKSPNSEFKGRVCRRKDNVVVEFEVDESLADCIDQKCKTPWAFVIFATTIIFGLLFLLLVVEIVWRMKQMSQVLDEKCRRQREELEGRLNEVRAERRKHFDQLLVGGQVGVESTGGRKGRLVGKVFVEEDDKAIQTEQ